MLLRWRPRFLPLLLGGLAVLLPLGAHAGPPFLTDDPDPEEYHQLDLIGFTMGTHTRGHTLAALPGVEADYGIAPHLELNAVTQFSLDTLNTGAYGPGDSQLGLKWRFIEEDKNGWRPKVAFSPVLYLPTGNAHRNLGQGDTLLLIPLWLEKNAGPWTVYGGGGYLASESHNATQSAWQEGVVALRQVTDHLQLGGEVFHEDGGSAADNGTGHTTTLNLGGSYILNDHQQIIFSAGRAVQQARATNLLDWYCGYQYEF